MKLKYNRKNHNGSRGPSKSRTLYPLLIILFIFATLYFFIFGDNGFYSHKNKMKIITRLEKENHRITEKIALLQEKNKGLKDMNPQYIEREARRIPLKKRGDVIIKLHHNSWIEELGKKYQRQYHKGLKPPPTKLSFIDHYKVLIAITVSLLIALLVTLLLPRLRQKASEGQKEEIG